MQPEPRLTEVLHGPAEIVLDPRARTVTVGEQPLILTRLGFDLLAVLLHRRGEVLTHDELASLAWGQEPIGEHGAILTGVYRLRMALDKVGATNVIRAVRGVGYTIDGPKKATPALLERPALEAAFRASLLPALLVDLEGRVVSANDAASALTGIEVATLERLPAWRDVLAQGAWSTAQPPFAAARKGHTPPRFAAAAIRPGREETQAVEVTMVPITGQLEQIGVLITLTPAAQAQLGGVNRRRDHGATRGSNGSDGDSEAASKMGSEPARHWRAG